MIDNVTFETALASFAVGLYAFTVVSSFIADKADPYHRHTYSPLLAPLAIVGGLYLVFGGV